MQQLRRALVAPSVLRSLNLSSSNAVPRAVVLDAPEAAAAFFPRFMTTPNAASAPATEEGQGSVSQAHINRMLYRARQRGWLELDLLVGMWAEREVSRLTPEKLKDLEVLLDQENPELYKWLTGQIEAPPSILRNTAFQSIRGEVKAAMDAHGAPEAAAKDGAQWVNAWQEYKKQLEEAGAKLGGETASKP